MRLWLSGYGFESRKPRYASVSQWIDCLATNQANERSTRSGSILCPSSLMDRQRSSKSYKCRFESCLGYYGNVGKRIKLPVCKTGPQGSWVRIPSLPLGYNSAVGRVLVWYARSRRSDSGYPNYAVYCGWHTKLFRKQLFLQKREFDSHIRR